MNEENIADLKSSCNKITRILNEAPEGDFMWSQLMCLGEAIKDFVNNPIVKNSGLIPKI